MLAVSNPCVLTNIDPLSVFLADLDGDWIAPSQACVNPIFSDNPVSPEKNSGAQKKKLSLALEDVVEPAEPSMRPDLIRTATGASGEKKAQVSLNDCLACSGCVTSAEAVLITAQSTTKLREVWFSHAPPGSLHS